MPRSPFRFRSLRLQRSGALRGVLVAVVLLCAGGIVPAQAFSAAPARVVEVGSARSPQDLISVTLRPRKAEPKARVKAVVAAGPGLANRKVVVQIRKGSRWKRWAEGRIDRRGRASVTGIAPARDGDYRVRAVASPKKGKPVASKPVTLTVMSEPLKVVDGVVVLTEGDAIDAATTYDAATGQLTVPATAGTTQVRNGDPLVVPPGDGFESGLLRIVTGVSGSADGALVYTTRQAALTEVFESIPASRAEVALTQFQGTVSDLPPWVRCSNCTAPRADGSQRLGAQQRPRTGATATVPQRRGGASLDAFSLAFDREIPVGRTTVAVNGNLDVGLVANLNFDTDNFKLKDWKVEAGVSYHSSLSATWNPSLATAEDPQRVDLGSIDGTWKGAIGPVPVWVDITGTLFLEFSASGEIELSAEVSSGGALKGGLRKGADGPDPFFAAPRSLDVSRTARASGSARGALGAELATDIYSVGGPRIAGGWQVEAEIAAEASQDGQPILSCSLTHGPFVDVSLGVSDGLAELLDLQEDSVDLWNSDFDQNPLFECPDGTNPPVVETTRLDDASIGDFYLASLDLTDKQDRDGTWALASGAAMPPGLSLASSGTITGTPSGPARTYALPVTFTDSRGRTGQGTVHLDVVDAAPTWDAINTSTSAGGYGALTCGLDAGRGWCWGAAFGGSLGDGSPTDYDHTYEPVPQPLDTQISDFTQIAPLGYGACALRATGQVYCWGQGINATLASDKLGTGERLRPSRVTTITKPWITLEAQGDNVCGIQANSTSATSGSLWCFGQNGVYGTHKHRKPQYDPAKVAPGTDWVSVAVIETAVCAIKKDATLWCTRSSPDGPGIFETSPQQVPGSIGIDWASIDFASASPSKPYNTYCGTSTSGALYCWGANDDQQVGAGQGDTTPVPQPQRVGTRTDWEGVTVGGQHVCATTADNTLWCWGSNSRYQLGDPELGPNAGEPSKIGFPYWKSVTAAFSRTCGVRTDGTGYCWGETYAPGDAPTIVREPELIKARAT